MAASDHSKKLRPIPRAYTSLPLLHSTVPQSGTFSGGGSGQVVCRVLGTRQLRTKQWEH